MNRPIPTTYRYRATSALRTAMAKHAVTTHKKAALSTLILAAVCARMTWAIAIPSSSILSAFIA